MGCQQIIAKPARDRIATTLPQDCVVAVTAEKLFCGEASTKYLIVAVTAVDEYISTTTFI